MKTTTEQWHKLDRFRRNLDRVYEEVVAPHPEVLNQMDEMVMTFKELIGKTGGLDVTDPDEMYGFCSGIAFTVASVTAQALSQCGSPDCFTAFAGHMDLGVKRIALVVRELLKPFVDAGLIPKDYSKKGDTDGDNA